MEDKIINNSLIALFGTIGSILVGSWDSNIQILFLFLITDYISGIMKGIKEKNISSQTGFKGILKKIAIFMVIIVAHQLDIISNLENPMFKTMTIYFYIGNEGISIIENLSVLGVAFPKFIEERLKNIKENNTK
ncbi:MAG: phage holin family protein [Peptostreptococcaceae bacterium]|nr:phage holin family protein [Peptostreptococcaceae bacterium]